MEVRCRPTCLQRSHFTPNPRIHIESELHAQRLRHRLAFNHHGAGNDRAIIILNQVRELLRLLAHSPLFKRHVAPELDPKLIADAWPNGRLKAGAAIIISDRALPDRTEPSAPPGRIGRHGRV